MNNPLSIFRCAAYSLLLTGALVACTVPEEYSNVPKTKKVVTDSPPPEPLEVPEPAEETTTASVGETEQKFIDEGLVDVQSLNADIRVELKYSTKENFVGIDLYGPLKKCYLRKEAAEKLARAQTLLSEKKPGWHLLCYDCARPRSIQKLMWDSLKIPNKTGYLSHPSKGSMHNYGVAVDLTVTDEKGKPLDMGTPFDFFGEKAQPRYESRMLQKGELTQEQVDNRKLLRTTMREARFSMIVTEWWHFIAFNDSLVYSRYKIIE